MPEAISPAEVCNREGNRALREQNYLAAVDSYSQGLLDECGGELRGVLLSNRLSFVRLFKVNALLSIIPFLLGVQTRMSRSAPASHRTDHRATRPLDMPDFPPSLHQ